ncbi:MAG TPA: hypothetical protein VG993_04275 [Actinomycetota bacterium]|jgi:hypothetical protein|nr:hypothetical protein [Actinomycetota bacterium]
MQKNDDVTAETVVEAASAASQRTADAIDRAAETNDDPEVATILEDAAASADATVSRVGWLRAAVRRLFRRD